MTVQEARNILNNDVKLLLGFACNKNLWCLDSQDKAQEIYRNELSALMKGIEALEKQIPKKPIVETISVSTNEPPLIVGFCPNCITNRPMVTNRYDLYCKSCGQALDWESEVTEND